MCISVCARAHTRTPVCMFSDLVFYSSLSCFFWHTRDTSNKIKRSGWQDLAHINNIQTNFPSCPTSLGMIPGVHCQCILTRLPVCLLLLREQSKISSSWELLQNHIAETFQDWTRVYLACILFPSSHPKSGFCFLLDF